jgi:hypothetical protein
MQHRINLYDSGCQVQSMRDGSYASDAEAFVSLRGMMGGAIAAELWCGNRSVGLVTAEEVQGQQILLNDGGTVPVEGDRPRNPRNRPYSYHSV